VFITVGAEYGCSPSCNAPSSYSEQRVWSASGEKILDKPDFEFIPALISLLKADLILKRS
jgi:hypothetical protein